jgi:hypothetical protein
MQSAAGYSAGTKWLRESLQKPVLPKCTSTTCRGNHITLGLPALPNKAIGSQVSDRTVLGINTGSRLTVSESELAMIDQEPWQYVLDRLQSFSKLVAHEFGRVNRAWAGCQFFQFGPEGEKNFLLTSPFIEQVFRKGVRRAGFSLSSQFCTCFLFQEFLFVP